MEQPERGEDLAVALVNSRVSGTRGTAEFVPDARALTAWMRDHGLSSRPANGAQLDRFRTLRDAARHLLTALERRESPEPGAVEVVNDLAAEAVRPRLRAAGGELRVSFVPVGSSSGDPVGALARDVIAFVPSEAARRLRTCAADDCDRMFVVTHGRQIWCSPGCGNRMRVNRHLRRRREPGVTLHS